MPRKCEALNLNAKKKKKRPKDLFARQVLYYLYHSTSPRPKDLNTHFFKENIQMSKKNVKICLVSFIIREMQAKTTMSHMW
jgi:hypothetical protein